MNQPTGLAGNVYMTSEPGDTCCAVTPEPVYNETDKTTVVEWQRCEMPVFGTVDLEDEKAEPWPLCFAHLVKVAGNAPYIPIRPLCTGIVP